MNAEQLLQHFERISEAPDAIKRLRRFILDLAVRGKLVEQDPEDEPAELLLQCLQQHSRKSGGSAFKGESFPFDLPVGWAPATLGNLVQASNSGWSPKTLDVPRQDEEWGILKVSAVSWERFQPNANKQVLPGTQPKPQAVVKKGDFLISRANTAELVARAVIVDCDPVNLMMSDKIVRLQLVELCEPRYILIVNNHANFARSYFANHATGVSPSMKNVSRDVILGLPLPLPPLAEQHRIVAKVDELMNLCDQLEAAKAEREQCRDNLVAASLQGLNQPAVEEETFREHARFTFANLPRITTRTSHIKQLRQTILGLAVRGKLVEQVPCDELEPANTASKININLPVGWQSGTVFDLAALKSGSSFPSEKELRHGEYIYVKVSDMNLPGNQYEITTSTRFISPNKQDLKSLIPANSIIFPKRGGAIATNKKRLVKTPIYADSNIMAIVCPPIIQLSYLYIWFLRIDLWGLNSGTSVPQINNKDIGPLVVPLPPLAEQQRIVAKVDELMAICDQLEAQITATEQDSRRFLESVLADALAPGIDLREVAEVA